MSSPRVVNKKVITEKLTTWLKNKTWTNPQIRNHEKSHDHRLIRPETQHNDPEHMSLNS